MRDRSLGLIVIGGGIAGLFAAFELRRQGHEPLVLEAQDRVGGRVHT
nr:FAD-dependent oxidoreductase [Gemmatimonadaceae bacterium]